MRRKVKKVAWNAAVICIGMPLCLAGKVPAVQRARRSLSRFVSVGYYLEAKQTGGQGV